MHFSQNFAHKFNKLNQIKKLLLYFLDHLADLKSVSFLITDSPLYNPVCLKYEFRLCSLTSTCSVEHSGQKSVKCSTLVNYKAAQLNWTVGALWIV